MRMHNKTTISLLPTLALGMVCLAVQSVSGAESDGESPTQAKARQAIMESLRWTKARQQLDDWLSVQSVYSDAQVEALKSELRNRISTLSASELASFLEEMEAKAAVLMSPASQDARRWAEKYTDKALDRIRKQYGVEDPIRMPSADIKAALRQFAADRQSRLAASAASSRSRESQAKAATSYQQAQATSAARSARKAASFGTASSPYAPKNNRSRVKTYRAAYPKMNYSVGPWGGVWVSPSHR